MNPPTDAVVLRILLSRCGPCRSLRHEVTCLRGGYVHSCEEFATQDEAMTRAADLAARFDLPVQSFPGVPVPCSFELARPQ